jgi:hypothetical protein
LRPGFPQAHSRNIRSNGQYGLLLLFRTVGTCKSVTQGIERLLIFLAKTELFLSFTEYCVFPEICLTENNFVELLPSAEFLAEDQAVCSTGAQLLAGSN